MGMGEASPLQYKHFVPKAMLMCCRRYTMHTSSLDQAGSTAPARLGILRQRSEQTQGLMRAELLAASPPALALLARFVRLRQLVCAASTLAQEHQSSIYQLLQHCQL